MWNEKHWAIKYIATICIVVGVIARCDYRLICSAIWTNGYWTSCKNTDPFFFYFDRVLSRHLGVLHRSLCTVCHACFRIVLFSFLIIFWNFSFTKKIIVWTVAHCPHGDSTHRALLPTSKWQYIWCLVREWNILF